jgi:hypothetical protein
MRRMDVSLLVGKPVVITMMGCPPERSFLCGRASKDRENELSPAGGLECTVGEVSMIESRDREHAEEVEEGCNGNGSPTPTHP